MTNDLNKPNAPVEPSGPDFFSWDVAGFVRTNMPVIFKVAAGSALLALIAGVAYLVWQPVRQVAVLEFRPTFDGAEQGRYPNGLAFGPTDIVAQDVLEQVYTANKIEQYCTLATFRSGFFVEQHSTEAAFLASDYQARLSDPRLTTVDRERLQLEYQAKSLALPMKLRLVFTATCAGMPSVIVSKVMDDILTTWARDSEIRRGVLRLHVQLLTPALFDSTGEMTTGSSRLLQADLARLTFSRIISNVDAVIRLPGAALVRVGADKISLVEIRHKMADLVSSQLEPLMVAAGRAMGRDSAAWVAAAVMTAQREHESALARVESYRQALVEYSGAPTGKSAAQPGAGVREGSTPDYQAPQVDLTFIDKIVELSEEHITFRQGLTSDYVEESLAAVETGGRLRYYQRLQESLRDQGFPTSSMSFDEQFGSIVAQGKALTARFNEIYEEFSKVSIRPAAAMYNVERPTSVETYRAFSITDLLVTALGVFSVVLLLGIVAAVIRDRMRPVPSRA